MRVGEPSRRLLVGAALPRVAGDVALLIFCCHIDVYLLVTIRIYAVFMVVIYAQTSLLWVAFICYLYTVTQSTSTALISNIAKIYLLLWNE